jgi:cytochrome P450
VGFANIETHSGGSDTVQLFILVYPSFLAGVHRVLQTVSAIYSVFLAMVLYPEVQRKAQEEIDRVIGNDRLPTVVDRESLPYVDALSKEVMRWHVVGPMGQIL